MTGMKYCICYKLEFQTKVYKISLHKKVQKLLYRMEIIMYFLTVARFTRNAGPGFWNQHFLEIFLLQAGPCFWF